VLDLTANLNLQVEQLDVKFIFLRSDLDEEIYMEYLRDSKQKAKITSLQAGKKVYMG